jgi:ABC-2 type transport system permease protein
MNDWLSFKISFQTIKDHFKITLILTLIFMGWAAMYCGMYPAFEDSLLEMQSSMGEDFWFFSGGQDMASFDGFLNLELYQIFWLLILAIIIAFVSASIVAKEIEQKTIDLFMSNPVSRKQLVFEKFLGLIPMTIIINIAVLISVAGTTILINESLNFSNLIILHLVSIVYFIAILSIGILVSVIINEKMRASIIMIALLVGMYIFQSLSLMSSNVEALGYISITHYFKIWTCKYCQCYCVNCSIIYMLDYCSYLF